MAFYVDLNLLRLLSCPSTLPAIQSIVSSWGIPFILTAWWLTYKFTTILMLNFYPRPLQLQAHNPNFLQEVSTQMTPKHLKLNMFQTELIASCTKSFPCLFSPVRAPLSLSALAGELRSTFKCRNPDDPLDMIQTYINYVFISSVSYN